jgi:hypothetical protein
VARGDPSADARAKQVSGIVITSLGIFAAIGLVASGALLSNCISARNRATGEGCDPSDLSLYSTITGVTAGFTLLDLGVGIPLWAVGQSKLSKIRAARLTIAPHLESGGVLGASAKLGFAF